MAASDEIELEGVEEAMHGSDDDLSQLGHLDDDTILHTLKRRYEEDNIYDDEKYIKLVCERDRYRKRGNSVITRIANDHRALVIGRLLLPNKKKTQKKNS